MVQSGGVVMMDEALKMNSNAGKTATKEKRPTKEAFL